MKRTRLGLIPLPSYLLRSNSFLSGGVQLFWNIRLVVQLLDISFLLRALINEVLLIHEARQLLVTLTATPLLAQLLFASGAQLPA